MPDQERSSNYYDLLGLSSSASPQQIRRAYREKSKLYHPDTTALPEAIATAKFQSLNEAYGTLSSPERRVAYDMKMGFSRVRVIQPPTDLSRSDSGSRPSRSAYLDASDRPLSAGEIFALFILGITFAACLLLVVAIGLTRGDQVNSASLLPPTPVPLEQALTAPPSDASLEETVIPVPIGETHADPAPPAIVPLEDAPASAS